jgi:hypothetical protein
MFRRALLAALMFAACTAANAQTVTQLAHLPPDGAFVTFLMTDGTVVAQGNGESDWWKLTPNNKGSYVNGSWARVADLPSGYQPLYFASAVLADGRLVISGGEYLFDSFAFTNMGAIYDPLADKWTAIGHPKGWGFIGDSPSTVLPDGRFVVGEKLQKNLAAFDPATLKWTALPNTGKNDFNAEEGWTLMPDGSILTYDVKDHPKAERYVPALGQWTSAGQTGGVDLRGPQDCCGCIVYDQKKPCYLPPGEVGPAVLMPDGRVFATGAIPQGETTAHTAIYSPPDSNHPKGRWKKGPDFPQGEDAGDNYIALMPNGHVLVEVDFGTGHLYDFDGTTLTRLSSLGSVGFASLTLLPTGEVLIGGSEVLKPVGTYKAAWAPTITSAPSSVTRGQTYQIFGTQFNGLSQATGMGDEQFNPSNYPLVRITNNARGHVFYARTHDHSTMGVATGAAIVSTNFDVPAAAETGASTVEVVANGIPSAKTAITVN